MGRDKKDGADGKGTKVGLGQIIVYLGRRFGWDKDFIARNMTVTQVQYYFIEARKQEMRELKLKTQAMMGAISATLMGDKEGHFKDFLEALDPKDPEIADLDEQLADAKESGIEIEEH